MKMQQSGFSVLEVIISIMISALLMTASLTIYNQISKGALLVQRITQNDTQIMIVHNRLITDLQGLIPLWFTKEHYEKLKKTEEGKDDQKISSSSSDGSLKQNNFLYAQSNNDQFDFLTFVSTNALQVYGDQLARTVRIVYMLKPDGDTFKLMRKEESEISGDFSLEKLKSGKFDQIAHKITKCIIEYGFIETDSKKAGENKDLEKPHEFKFVSKWGGATQSNTQEEKTPTLPDVLKLKISMQTNRSQDDVVYELFCTIPTSHAPSIKSFAQKRKEKQKESAPEQPQAKGQSPTTHNAISASAQQPVAAVAQGAS